ncbi:hypothetical protein [Mangrovicoccus sp. HB161399]|uniref:hypothetical protein n=1 Tax=Mangrovicoccus sp. HB161399 TaxID=2720392 RepID=UPI0015519F13|nr:hypothetical protein [Mangrovicoccus sp. HB161399]
MLLFARHEAWVLRTRRKAPFFGPLFLGTFFPWMLIPAIPVGISMVFLMEKAFILAMIFGWVGRVGGIVVLVPWYFRRDCTDDDLRHGRAKRALKKERELSACLDRLQATDPREAVRELRVFPKRKRQDSGLRKQPLDGPAPPRPGVA